MCHSEYKDAMCSALLQSINLYIRVMYCAMTQGSAFWRTSFYYEQNVANKETNYFADNPHHLFGLRTGEQPK